MLNDTQSVTFEIAETAVIAQGTTVIETELVLLVATGLVGILAVSDVVLLQLAAMTEYLLTLVAVIIILGFSS